MRFELNAHTVTLCLAAGFALACGGAEGSDQAEDVAQSEQAIVNGTSVASTGQGYPLVFTKTLANGNGTPCSGVLVTNSWVFTAKSNHCDLAINNADPSYTTQIVTDYGTAFAQQRRAIQIVNHPQYDVALVQVNSGFNMPITPTYSSPVGFARTLYPWNDLLNQNVTAYGYGANAIGSDGYPTGYKVLRSGAMRVTQTGFTFDDEVSTGNPGIQLNSTTSPNQMIYYGDSGGPLIVSTLTSTSTLAGISVGGPVDANNLPIYGVGIPTSAISQWAIRTIYPNSALACHRNECLTTQSSLANNTSYSTSWNLCGSYRSSWEAQIDMESGHDYFYVNGRALTGNTTYSGVEAPGALQLRLTTDAATPSAGVKWLKIRCLQ